MQALRETNMHSRNITHGIYRFEVFNPGFQRVLLQRVDDIPDMIISGNEEIHFPLPQGRVGRAHHGDHDERRDADRLRHHPQNPRRKAPGRWAWPDYGSGGGRIVRS